MAELSDKGQPSSSAREHIQSLIEVTERKVRAEERVAALLSGLMEYHQLLLEAVKDLETLHSQDSARLEAVLQNTVLLARMLGAYLRDDMEQARRLQERLVNGYGEKGVGQVTVQTGGMSLGNDANVGVEGDMVGRDKKEVGDG